MDVPTLHLPDEDDTNAQISSRRTADDIPASDSADDIERTREDFVGDVSG